MLFRSKTFIRLFWIPYLTIIGISAFGGYQVATNGPWFEFFYDIGRKFGQLALILLGVVVIPGILGRFKVEIKITRVVTLFRRQLGDMVFLLAYAHFMILRGASRIFGVVPFQTPYPVFEAIGILALTLLFPLFLTSNNWSVRVMGAWWKRLHRLIYVILWLVVIHTGLQRISVWTVLIGFFAILEVVSLVYDRWRKKSIQANN